MDVGPNPSGDKVPVERTEGRIRWRANASSSLDLCIDPVILGGDTLGRMLQRQAALENQGCRAPQTSDLTLMRWPDQRRVPRQGHLGGFLLDDGTETVPRGRDIAGDQDGAGRKR